MQNEKQRGIIGSHPRQRSQPLETDVFLDRQTANQFVVKNGVLYSVNARATQWPPRNVPDGMVCRGRVVDWRWSCCMVSEFGLLALDERTGETRAARHFGLLGWDALPHNT